MKIIRVTQIIQDPKEKSGYRFEPALINPENIAVIALDKKPKKLDRGVVIIGDSEMETITLIDFRGGQMRGMAVTESLEELEKAITEA